MWVHTLCYRNSKWRDGRDGINKLKQQCVDVSVAYSEDWPSLNVGLM